MGSDVISIEHALARASQSFQEGRYADAELACSDVLAINPRCAEALGILGNVALASGRADVAVGFIQQATELKPRHVGYRLSLGQAFEARGDLDAAIAAYRSALRLAPNFEGVHMPLARVLHKKGFAQAACETARQAADLRRAYELVKQSRHDIECGRVTEALSAAREAVAAWPGLPGAHTAVAIALLLRGDLQAAWPHYLAAHMKRVSGTANPRFWDGSPLDGRTIVLHGTGGYGDVIQFVRYTSVIASGGGRVVLLLRTEYAPLFRLLETLAGIEQIVRDETAVPPVDLMAYLHHLPALFNTSASSIPAPIPYLHPDRRLVAVWADRLRDSDAALRVGLVWAGDPGHVNDRHRSMALTQLAPLWRTPGVTFYSVQKGLAAAQIGTVPAGTLVDLTGHIHDFADTAALMANLDVVISVDTSSAHLAGAIGRPVWLLVPFAPDERWMLDREDSPWYPTMRLFRQRSIGDWQHVIGRVARELWQAAGNHPRQRPFQIGLTSVT